MTEKIEITLRYKWGTIGAIESFERITVPEGTDISDLLNTINASDLMRNHVMPFTGDWITRDGPLRSGPLEPGCYTAYGLSDRDRTKIQERIREKYRQ
jgi:hypothetical protein